MKASWGKCGCAFTIEGTGEKQRWGKIRAEMDAGTWRGTDAPHIYVAGHEVWRDGESEPVLRIPKTLAQEDLLREVVAWHSANCPEKVMA